MREPHLVIVGGGLAGLATGCYARASGFRTTVVEHTLALGGACTAWTRGPYVIDGCIHWLTGGPFSRIYEELGITGAVELRTLERFATYRDVSTGVQVEVTRDLDALGRELIAIAPEDAAEIRRLLDGAAHLVALEPEFAHPQALTSLRDRFASVWSLRHELPTLVHFRKPLAEFAEQHLHSPLLRRFLESIAPPESPAFFLMLMLGYLQRGWLCRPQGGSAGVRSALVATYLRAGGEARLPATVEEVLVAGGRARGVRLADGTVLEADAVVSTVSSPETVVHLLGGKFGAADARTRPESLQLFRSIVLASFGVADPLTGAPQLLLVDGIEPFQVGSVPNDRLHLHVYNDDPAMAPPGHTVVQAMLQTNYSWWATRGSRYDEEKDTLAARVLEKLERLLPGVKGAVRLVDVATPLTFWTMARSWRGSYEGFLPSAEALLGNVEKTVRGLADFYMAGQWVEPGGGVPTALASGRQAVELLCAEKKRRFVPLRAS